MIEAFAVTREAAKRVLGQRHFDVQMMGGAALHFGWIAEMKTGEGKTLVSTLPAYLNGLTGKGMHIVTVNDYLASFHAEWMGRLHNFLGLIGRPRSSATTCMIVPRASRPTRPTSPTAPTRSSASTTCTTTWRADQRRMAQRGHVFAIIDEVDSILIDEARTPLIISGPAQESAQLYAQFAAIARGLVRDADYEVDEEKRTVAAHRGGHREGRGGARRGQHVRRRVRELRPPADARPCAPRSCTSATRTTW